MTTSEKENLEKQFGPLPPGKVRILVILIMGRSQDLGESSRVGMQKLWSKLLHFNDGTFCYVMPPFRWNAKWKAVARYIVECTNENSIIIISPYSWGCGWGLVQLLLNLVKLGHKFEVLQRRVHTVVSCDGVWRHWLWKWPNPLNIWAMIAGQKIKLPDIVDNLHWFRQYVNKPAGHTIEVGPSCFESPVQVLKVGHNDMDEQLAYHDQLIRVVEDVTGNKRKPAA